MLENCIVLRIILQFFGQQLLLLLDHLLLLQGQLFGLLRVLSFLLVLQLRGLSDLSLLLLQLVLCNHVQLLKLHCLLLDALGLLFEQLLLLIQGGGGLVQRLIHCDLSLGLFLRRLSLWCLACLLHLLLLDLLED